MPTIDRKPRARRRTKAATDFTSALEVRAAVLATHADDDAWRAARSRVARFLLGHVGDAERALAIADAYHRRPELMPMQPPNGFTG